MKIVKEMNSLESPSLEGEEVPQAPQTLFKLPIGSKEVTWKN
jgi:hypothetical protein